MEKSINIISSLYDQIIALLDLIQSNKGADEDSIKMAAEMSITMLMELVKEAEEMTKVYKCSNSEACKLIEDERERILKIIQEGEATDIGRKITIERIYAAIKGAEQ